MLGGTSTQGTSCRTRSDAVRARASLSLPFRCFQPTQTPPPSLPLPPSGGAHAGSRVSSHLPASSPKTILPLLGCPIRTTPRLRGAGIAVVGAAGYLGQRREQGGQPGQTVPPRSTHCCDAMGAGAGARPAAFETAKQAPRADTSGGSGWQGRVDAPPPGWRGARGGRAARARAAGRRTGGQGDPRKSGVRKATTLQRECCLRKRGSKRHRASVQKPGGCAQPKKNARPAVRPGRGEAQLPAQSLPLPPSSFFFFFSFFSCHKWGADRGIWAGWGVISGCSGASGPPALHTAGSPSLPARAPSSPPDPSPHRRTQRAGAPQSAPPAEGLGKAWAPGAPPSFPSLPSCPRRRRRWPPPAPCGGGGGIGNRTSALSFTPCKKNAVGPALGGSAAPRSGAPAAPKPK